MKKTETRREANVINFFEAAQRLRPKSSDSERPEVKTPKIDVAARDKVAAALRELEPDVRLDGMPDRDLLRRFLTAAGVDLDDTCRHGPHAGQRFGERTDHFLLGLAEVEIERARRDGERDTERARAAAKRARMAAEAERQQARGLAPLPSSNKGAD